MSTTLTGFDWLVIGLYFLFNLALGLYCARRAGANPSEFFLSGRNIPWWLAGTSMVATTFAADTPLAVTGLVASNGIAGNWLWWSMVTGGMLTVFLYARLWRRAGVMTDVEFAELRYSGGAAAFLRGFRALYLGIPINCIVIGWVNKAMLTILTITLGLDTTGALYCLLFLLCFTAFYTTLSGLWGVLLTDLFQFVLMMGMIVTLAVFAVGAAGGLDGLARQVHELDAVTGYSGSRLAFFPDLQSEWMPAVTFFVYLGMVWWASWYPGAEPGGGGYVAQRIFSARTEKDGLLATLWFNVAHYALRPWPWILTALAALVLYPDMAAEDKAAGAGYIRILMDPAVFPPALRGFMLASFAAAYMSTIGTQLNWGASYVLNDFYRRFLVREATDRHYVVVSRVVTVALVALSIVVTLNLESIQSAWKLLLVTGAGTGTVLLLRWYWWRINAWSEVSSMVAAAVFSILFQLVVGWDTDEPRQMAYVMIATVGLTTVVWLAVTFLTAPVPMEKLARFYRLARPEGPGWNPVARQAGVGPFCGLALRLLDTALGVVLIYAALFGTGYLIFGRPALGAANLALAVAAGAWLHRNLSRQDWSEPAAAREEQEAHEIESL